MFSEWRPPGNIVPLATGFGFECARRRCHDVMPAGRFARAARSHLTGSAGSSAAEGYLFEDEPVATSERRLG
jgi:hypothetical protein